MKTREASCPLCQKLARKLIQPRTKVKYAHCADCNFRFRLDLINSEKELEIYQHHQNFVGDERYIAYFEKFLQSTVLPFLDLAGQEAVLDFGSGPEPVLAEHLKASYGLTVDIYDKFFAPDQGYLQQKYDLIFCTEVIEHLPDPLTYFKLFKSLLRPKGYLAIMTQQSPSRDDAFLDWHYIRDDSHISFYSKKSLEKIASSFGFSLLYLDQKSFLLQSLD